MTHANEIPADLRDAVNELYGMAVAALLLSPEQEKGERLITAMHKKMQDAGFVPNRVAFK